ncbi:hypothetical protein BS50DRAFT_279128 [Corynespora cassiicola Philippines]|uniref:Ecp2 effector protein domain-containing protein n=1 Tax=Corynespora cassiicola Philippines TaxID=1448308 RepID=A0A2T2P0Q2_CORCC|nr:hypothetical protein BS50DRAFT_279128 [Corynespora cassiicola Philippines]
MRFFTIITALVSAAAVSARPTTGGVELAKRDINLLGDGRGATVWKQRNFVGTLEPNEKTAIPGNNYCANLDAVYGDWDKKIRSLTVEKGYKCSFYTVHNCVAKGHVLQLGSKDQGFSEPELEPQFDQTFQSAVCAKL